MKKNLMKGLTAKVFSLHSWLGVFAGTFMIVIGLTGSLIVFSDELNELIYREQAFIVPEGEPKSFDALLSALYQQYPDAKVLRLTKSDSPKKAYTAVMQLGKERLYTYLNPYTGKVTGQIEVHSRLTNWLLRLHFTLLMRPFGDGIVALVGFCFIGLSLTGLWIQRKSLFSVYTKPIRWKAGTKVASHDFHLLIGSASVLFCLVMSITGFYMMLYIFDPEWWQRQFVARSSEQKSQPIVLSLSTDSLMNVARGLISDFEPKSLILPQNEKAPIRVLGYATSSNPFYNELSSYVNFKQDGTVLKVQDIRTASFSEKADMMLRSIHFGQFGGIFVKIIYSLGGFTPAILSVTGLVLWWKRRRKNISVMQPQPSPKPTALPLKLAPVKPAAATRKPS
ncbi:MAG: PepSY-associated TM helix domain-containing protein [Chloroherpetonaceae bacterium]|nr:PepSY domain-containing protein [Chloroherpetonaceae bacterium]MCS7210549.1 PepSY domain-containing protein [Chloroherpetonaceae bacterium]MDW8020536.1 PepSY-associated TM helix domain-containing protein [Chloroherpetonaceae bacterium]MDW8467195.1 PepSY-associated TM helix domain-containing protein [Chloroherpetonaceae bacterium]